jgi:hypothetical protein
MPIECVGCKVASFLYSQIPFADGRILEDSWVKFY